MSDNAKNNAAAWLESIRDMVAKLEKANDPADADAGDAIEEARTEILESPLSVQVRDGWRAPGAEPTGAVEYEILLSTGGPALRIIGDLNEHCEPDDEPSLQWQDWGTPWTPYQLDSGERSHVQQFAAQFYFGEG